MYDLSYLFYGCSSLLSINLYNFNTTNVKDMSYMFYNCTSLKSINLSNFTTEKLTNLDYMFYYCSNLIYLDISKFEISSDKNISIFNTLPDNGLIKIRKNFSEIIPNQIPSNWNISIVDK
jgi:surface protein